MLVDDHAVVRAGIRRLLGTIPAVEIGFEASRGHDAIEFIRTHHPDCVILDLSLPDMSGIDCLRRMRAIQPDLNVLVFSMHDEAEFARMFLKAGARGYLCKGSGAEDFLEAVETVIGGRFYISETMTQSLASADTLLESRAPHTKLSTREFQIFMDLASGRALSEVAKSMYLSANTVSTHRHRILEKMRLASNFDLTYYAVKYNLIK